MRGAAAGRRAAMERSAARFLLARGGPVPESRVMRTAGLALALAFSSCGGEPGPSHPASDPPASAPPTTADPQAEGESPPPSTATAEPSAPSEPPRCVVRGEPTLGGVAISVENHGAHDVSLRAAVIVEGRTAAGAFEAHTSESTLSLRPDCSHDAERCVTLAPGGELRPPIWNGMFGDMQCECDRCAPAGPGTYRFVVESCDGQHRVEGEPFELTEH